MSDLILRDGDKAFFLPAFGQAMVVVRPGDLQGSGPAEVGGKRVCVEGDEAKLSVPGCPYTTPQHTIPGIGTLKIAALAGDQKARKTRSGGKAALLKGSVFIAAFDIQSPAQQPPPASAPDPMVRYSGSGTFLPSNVKVRGS